MRIDTDYVNFGNYEIAGGGNPNYIVFVEYDFGVMALCSGKMPENMTYEGRTPVQVWPNVIHSVSSVSQRIKPVEGQATIGGLTIKSLNRIDRSSTSTSRRIFDFSGEEIEFRSEDFLNGDEPFEVRCRFYVRETNALQRLFSISSVLGFYVSAAEKLYAWRWNQGAGWTFTTLDVTLEKDNELSVRYSPADGELTVTLNGKTEVATMTGTLTGAENFGVGYEGSNGYLVDGYFYYIDVYQNDDLVASYTLDENQGNTFYDRVGGHDMTQKSFIDVPTGWVSVWSDSVANFFRERLLDSPPETANHKRVSIYKGYTNNFDHYVQFVTAYLSELNPDGRLLELRCADSTQQMRKNIFDLATTRLAADLTASGTGDISVTSVTGFEMMQHTDAFTDEPGSLVGYIRVKESGEIIRYTGISDSPLAFTGITRGVMSTTETAVDVEETDPVDQWPEIEEFVYLEMPAPQLAYAIMTGTVLGSSPAITLPDRWHMGVNPDEIDAASFENIGPDLYDGDTKGLILRFRWLSKVDGKQFLEKEVYRLASIYPDIGADGRLGLSRVTLALSSSPFLRTLGASNVRSYGKLRANSARIINQYIINYQWNGETYLRRASFTDTESISRNEVVNTKTLNFKGLDISRHTLGVIYNLVNIFVDRFRNAPLELDLDLHPYFNAAENGDIYQVDLSHYIVDVTNPAFGALRRPMEVQQLTNDYINGRVRARLFAPSGDPTSGLDVEGGDSTTPVYQPEEVLDDQFYSMVGTDINSLPEVSAGTVNSDVQFSGNDSMNANGAVYYHVGDLTIPNGVTVTITKNVQLRILGTLTINGTLEGVGRGHAGTSDQETLNRQLTAAEFPPANSAGASGFIGNTTARCGIVGIISTTVLYGFGLITNRFRGSFTTDQTQVLGQETWFPSNINPTVPDQSASPYAVTHLEGVPDNLQGTGGSHGSRLYTDYREFGESYDYTIDALGGDGGDGGAGLTIISRGLAFGLNGEIDLSGTDGSAGNSIAEWRVGPTRPDSPFGALFDLYDTESGGGSGGGPGSLLVLLDGSDTPSPIVLPNFIANIGDTPLASGGGYYFDVSQREGMSNYWDYTMGGEDPGYNDNEKWSETSAPWYPQQGPPPTLTDDLNLNCLRMLYLAPSGGG